MKEMSTTFLSSFNLQLSVTEMINDKIMKWNLRPN